MKLDLTSKYILGIVGIVALVAVVVMMMNSSGFTDLSGQVVAAARNGTNTTGYCGDGRCAPPETPSLCPRDCARGNRTNTTGYCGDGRCAPPETPSLCPRDCTGGNRTTTNTTASNTTSTTNTTSTNTTNTTALSDLVADESSTLVAITDGIAYVREDGVVVGLNFNPGRSGYTDITLHCGVSNAGAGMASGKSYSYCYFKDAEGGSTISNTFTNEEISLTPGSVHTWEKEDNDFSAINTSNTNSKEVALMSWLTEYYADSSTQAHMFYDVDYHSSYNIVESNEENNEEWVSVDANVTLTWELADFDCTNDSHCGESEYCNYTMCVETE